MPDHPLPPHQDGDIKADVVQGLADIAARRFVRVRAADIGSLTGRLLAEARTRSATEDNKD